MKVLLVQPYAVGPGHYDSYTRKLCAALCERGVELTLLTAAGTKGGWERQLRLHHIPVMDRRSLFLFSQGSSKGSVLMKRARLLWTGWRVEGEAFALFATGRYEALHFVDAEPLSLFVHFALSGRPPHVFITVHEPYKFPPWHAPFLRYTYDPLRRAVVRCLFQHVRPITLSRHVRDSLFEFSLVPVCDVPVIPFGIDVPLVTWDKTEARRRLGIGRERTIFGFLGHLLPQKGFPLLLEAWPSVRGDCTLLVVAHSDSADKDVELGSQVQALNTAGRVICKFGYVSEGDLALYTCACDAVLLPYMRSFQGESGTLAQAVAHQVPLIAADVGAVGEAVRNSGLGVVHEPESSASLLAAIERFLQLKEGDISQIKQNMKSFAASRGWSEVASQLVCAYRRGQE
jgi:glycosyltransferase involved in cell wall biosynthesis